MYVHWQTTCLMVHFFGLVFYVYFVGYILVT